jgi:RNA polymerase sigma-70 factor (ECF subfamily)
MSILETEKIVLLNEEIKELMIIIDSFDFLNKTIFYKRYFYYESHLSIARSVGLTQKAVEKRLDRMRSILRKLIRQGEDEK